MPATSQQFSIADWEKVPGRVNALLPVAVALRTAHGKAAAALGLLPVVSLSWEPESRLITLHTQKPASEFLKRAYAEKLAAGAVTFTTEAPAGSAVLIKTATWFPQVGEAWRAANNAIGGPTPLSNAIVSGLALGGLGYGVGTVAEQVLPERILAPGKLRQTLATLGLLGGAGIGGIAAQGSAKAHDKGFWQSWLTNNNTPIPQKTANFGGGYTNLQAPTIKVDAFNRAVWADASRGYDQTGIIGHTTAPVAAATTGIMSGIATRAQSSIISPATVINTLASAGVGLATASIAGRTIGALAGLTPQAQEKIQDIGLWGGVLHTIIPPLFNNR
jgi:hypothetical protein